MLCLLTSRPSRRPTCQDRVPEILEFQDLPRCRIPLSLISVTAPRRTSGSIHVRAPSLKNIEPPPCLLCTRPLTLFITQSWLASIQDATVQDTARSSKRCAPRSLYHGPADARAPSPSRTRHSYGSNAVGTPLTTSRGETVRIPRRSAPVISAEHRPREPAARRRDRCTQHRAGELLATIWGSSC